MDDDRIPRSGGRSSAVTVGVKCDRWMEEDYRWRQTGYSPVVACRTSSGIAGNNPPPFITVSQEILEALGGAQWGSGLI